MVCFWWKISRLVQWALLPNSVLSREKSAICEQALQMASDYQFSTRWISRYLEEPGTGFGTEFELLSGRSRAAEASICSKRG
jgi:hypothetical protein